MKKYFWFKNCPLCNQGRLLIAKNDSANKLYLHCEECEQGYEDPLNLSKSFLTLDKDFEMSWPTEAEIDSMGWKEFKLNHYEE